MLMWLCLLLPPLIAVIVEFCLWYYLNMDNPSAYIVSIFLGAISGSILFGFFCPGPGIWPAIFGLGYGALTGFLCAFIPAGCQEGDGPCIDVYANHDFI